MNLFFVIYSSNVIIAPGKMVQAVHGTLITCPDDSVKQIILFLDNKMHFIIEDLDSQNVLVDSSQIDALTESLNKILSENSYTKTENDIM